MSRYIAKSGTWTTPSETSGSIQNISTNVTIEVTSDATEGNGLVLSPMQVINFDGAIYVRSLSKKDAPFVAVPFEVSAGGGGGGGGSSYTLPTASTSVKGGVKIGQGLTMTGEVLSIDTIPIATYSAKSYVVNDVVCYQGKLYRCTTAHTATSTFDSTKWAQFYANLNTWTAGYIYSVNDTVIYGGSLYICTTAHTATSTFDTDSWSKVGGDGDAKLTEAITANTLAGAISSGDVIAKDTEFTEFVKKLLISEIAPTMTFTATNSGLVKNGDSVSTVLTVKLTSAGTGTYDSIVFMQGSTTLDTQSYVSGTSTYTYTPSSAITSTTTFKAVLNYTKSDSSSATITKSVTFTFVDPIYYGAVSSAPTTEAEVLAVGNETAANSRARTVTYSLSNQRSCYCYPSSLGALTSIKDANNFEYINSYTRTTVTANSVSYYVYTLTDPVTISTFKQIFA